MKPKYEVRVEVVIRPVVETLLGPDYAADLIAGPDYPLHEVIEEAIRDGNFEIAAIETVGEVP